MNDKESISGSPEEKKLSFYLKLPDVKETHQLKIKLFEMFGVDVSKEQEEELEKFVFAGRGFQISQSKNDKILTFDTKDYYEIL